MKSLKIVFVVALCLGLLAYFLNTVKPPMKGVSNNSEKLQIVTSFYPLYYFTTQIAGDKANVSNVTPAGAEPHDYEPSTQDIASMEKASIIVLNGGQLEAWGDKIKENIKNKPIEVVVASEGLITQEVEMEGKVIKDPHIWLDPVLAQQEVHKIVEALTKVDPKNSEYYKNNETVLIKKLHSLDTAFKDGLKECTQKNIVTSHAAFGYIASRYGLRQLSISGLSPDEEPSAKQLAEVSVFAKQNNIKYIFFETLISPKLSETIAREIGAKTIVFNPLEGLTKDEVSEGKDYFSVQKDNLTNLRTALECK